MKFNIQDFKEDEAKKDDGIWVDLGAGARIKVASLSTERFQDWFRKKTTPWTKLKKDVPADAQRSIMIEGLARFILLEWEGIYDGETLLPFTVDNAIRVLTEIRWFLDRVIEESREYSNFCVKAAEEIEGN